MTENKDLDTVRRVLSEGRKNKTPKDQNKQDTKHSVFVTTAAVIITMYLLIGFYDARYSKNPKRASQQSQAVKYILLFKILPNYFTVIYDKDVTSS